MKLLAATLVLLVGACSGCGYATVDRTYDEHLVAAIGRGSDSVTRVAAVIDPARIRSTDWTAADQQASGHLVRGELGKLSYAALARLDRENATGARRLDALLNELRDREDEVRTSLVSSRRNSDLSSDARTFVRRWNGFLVSTANTLRNLRQTMRAMKPMLADMVALTSAARQAKATGMTSKFARVRRFAIADLVRRQTRLQGELRSITRQTPAERRFGEFVNRSREAQAIVLQVSRRFPHGFFAQLVREGR